MEIKEISNASKRNIKNISKGLLERIALTDPKDLNLNEMKNYKELKLYFKETNVYFFDAFNDTIKGENYVAGFGNDIQKFAFGKAMSLVEDIFDVSQTELQEDYTKLVKQLDSKYNGRYLVVEEEMYERMGTNINTIDELSNNGRTWIDDEKQVREFNLEYRTKRDTRVRSLHRTYHGVVWEKSNTAWLADNYILDDIGCRCVIIETAKPINNDEHSPLTNSWKERDGLGFIPSEEERLVPSDHPYMIAADDNRRFFEDFIK